MATQPIDRFATRLAPETQAAVYNGTKIGHEKRTKMLFDHYADPNQLRRLAGEIKQHVVENLDTYLPAVEARLQANGVKVHWAATAESACNAVLEIMQARGATKMVAHPLLELVLEKKSEIAGAFHGGSGKFHTACAR